MMGDPVAQQAIAKAKESLAHVEQTLKDLHESGAIDFLDYLTLEGPIRFTRTNILNV
jgi:hypothetical protein